MKTRGNRSVGLLGALALSTTAVFVFADTRENPFLSIVEKNPFKLTPPPPPPPPPEEKPVEKPAATIEVTGITSILKSKRALLEITEGPGKPVKRPPPLAEGESVGTVEVVAIDLVNNKVTIRNGAVTTNLSLKAPAKGTSGPGAPVAGAPPAAAVAGIGAPPVPATPTLVGGTSTAGRAGGSSVVVVGGNQPSAAPAAAGVTTYGTAAPQPPPYGVGATFSGTPSGNVTVSGGGDTLKNIPSRVPRTGNPTAQPQGMDPAVQYLDWAVKHEAAKQTGRPFPPPPPIPGLNPPGLPHQ